MDCESHKPSGLPVGQHTAEDWEYLQAGEDFEFPAEAPPVRYIRFKVLETMGRYGLYTLYRIYFLGQCNI